MDPENRERYGNAYAGKRVLVTGGLGFIGSNLARELVELEADVLLVDSLVPDYGGNLFNISGVEDRLKVNVADVRDANGMRYLVGERDYLFNLAGQVSHIDSMQDPMTDLEINCRSQLSILEACRHVNPEIRIVFASTRQIYGKPVSLPADEQHPVCPTDVNGINKASGEMYHRIYHEAYGLRTTSLRLTNTYGPRQLIRHNRQGFAGWFIRQVVCGETIQIFGDGGQKRDFNYVGDVVRAFLLAGVSPEAVGDVFNLGASPPVTLKDFVELLYEVAGEPANYRMVPFPEERKRIDIGDFYTDCKKIENLLGWRPQVELREGVRRTIDFYRNNITSYLS